MIQSSEYCRSVYSVTFHRTLSGFGATFTVLLRSDSLLANCFPNRLEMQQRGDTGHRQGTQMLTEEAFLDKYRRLTLSSLVFPNKVIMCYKVNMWYQMNQFISKLTLFVRRLEICGWFKVLHSYLFWSALCLFMWLFRRVDLVQE